LSGFKNAGGFSIRDLYGSGATLSTNEQTIPEDEEREDYQQEVVVNDQGKQEVVDKKVIWGALILIGALLLILHFIE
jgi:hypothetical protein